MFEGNLNNKIRHILWVLIILLLPFDSSPLAPGGVIRPLSIYPTVLYFLIYFKISLKVSKEFFRNSLFIVVLLVFTLFVNIISYSSVLGFAKFLYNVFFTGVYIYVILDYIEYYKCFHQGKQFMESFSKLWLKASIFPCVLGVLQFIFINFLDRGIIDEITSFFVYKTTGRIQLTFGEQTFSVIYLILSYILILKFHPKCIIRKVLMFIYVLLFFVSASTYGFLAIIFSVFVYIVLYRVGAVFRIALYMVFAGIIFYILFPYLPEYTQVRIITIGNILRDFDIFLEVASKDDSIFLRIVNPYIALISLEYSHFIGAGGDSFGYLYPKILLEQFPYVANNPQIAPIVDGEIIITPKNMYLKILSEFGVLFGGIILLYIYNLVRKIDSSSPFALFSVVILALWLQFDAYFYPNFIVFIVLIYYSIKNSDNYSLF